MTGLRIVMVGMAIGGMAIWIKWIIQNRKNWMMGVAPVMYLANVSSFFIARLTGIGIPVEVLNMWSTMIHLHALILGMGAGMIFWRQERDGQHPS